VSPRPPARPVLWHFGISHFTEKARWALDHKGIPHERRMLFLDYPIRVPLRTGQMRLPVLLQEGRAITGSDRIIDLLERQQPSPALYPEAPADRERALALQSYFDRELGPHIRAWLVGAAFARGAAATAEVFGIGSSERAKAMLRGAFPVFRPFYVWRHAMGGDRVALGARRTAAALERLVREIGPAGHLAGDAFSVADLAAAALAYPIALPDEYPYPFPPGLRALAEELFRDVPAAARDWVREIYQRHRGRFADAGASPQGGIPGSR